MFITGLLILVIAASGFVNFNTQNKIKHYEMGELSFDYPDTWNITSEDNSTVSFFDTEDLYNVTIIKQRKPQGYSLKNSLELNSAGNINKNFQLLSKNNLTVNGLEAYENNYRINDTQRKEIWFEKNNKIYSVIYTGPSNIENEDFSILNLNLINSKGSFDKAVNSIQIKDNASASQSTHWAELSIPSIHAEWWITSKSVNTANSVYHMPNSYYPGEKGEMALMGHHTTHHAPFLYINTLDPGDEVIIKDFLTQKKYIYEVEYNGDIRWGVKGKDIEYKASEEPKLLLITCY